MSDNFVQAASNTGTTTCVVTLNSVVAGNNISVIAQCGSTDNPTIHTVSDTPNGAYTAKGSPLQDATNNVYTQLFVLENASAGTHTITFTSDASSALFAIAIETGTTSNPAFSGSNGSVQASPGTGANALTSGSVTVTAAATQYCYSNDTSVDDVTKEPSVGTGFTSRANNSNSIVGAWRLSSKAASANGASTATAITGTDRFSTLGFAILNGAGGGSTAASRAGMYYGRMIGAS